MTPLRSLTIILLGTMGAAAWQVAYAADLPDGTIMQPDTQLPAVSGINGKWEFDPGILTSSAGVRAAGSITVPVGDRFGVQGDGMLLWNGNGVSYGAGIHAFTRDPSKYLFGVTSAFIKTPGATLGAVGLEGELYLDNISLEGWAGWAGLDYVDPLILDKSGAFAIGDIAYYVTPDLRLSIGASDVLGDTALRLGGEYQFSGMGMPLSLKGDARIHSDGSYSLTVGLKGYFGGSGEDKTLIDRHRQDDPQNKVVDLFASAGSQVFTTADPEAACLAQAPTDNEHVWEWNPSTLDCENVYIGPP